VAKAPDHDLQFIVAGRDAEHQLERTLAHVGGAADPQGPPNERSHESRSTGCLPAPSAILQAFPARCWQGGVTKDTDPGVFDRRGEIAWSSVTIHFHKASNGDLQIRLLYPYENPRARVLKKRHLVIRRTVSDYALEMNGIPLPSLLQSECAYLGHSGEEVGLVGRIRCCGRSTHECREDRNSGRDLVVGRRTGLASGLCTTITAFRIAGWVASPTPGRGISSAADGRADTQHGETSTAWSLVKDSR
jgi:hypothetical protein